MTRSSSVLFLAGTLGLTAAWSAAAAPATPAPDLMAVQLQILESTRRTNELNAEQNQKTIEQASRTALAASDQNKAAIELVQKMAQASIDQNKAALDSIKTLSSQAIDNARLTNEHAKDALTAWGAMLALITALVGWLGWKGLSNVIKQGEAFVAEMRGLRDGAAADLERVNQELVVKANELEADLAARMDAARRRIDAAVAEIEQRVKDFEIRVDERFQVAGSMGVDAASFIFAREPFIRDPEALQTQPEVFQDLFTRLDVIEAKAAQLADPRMKSWVESNRALLHHYKRDYATALRHQKEACEHITEETRFDRQRNLACMAWKHHETRGAPDSLHLALATLGTLEGYVTPSQALELLNDSDLAPLFTAHPAHAQALRAKAALA